MFMSFHVGAIGARSSLDRLSVVSNNLANVNTTGFKPKTSSFTELINYNLHDSEDAVTELQAGAGMKVSRTYTNFGTSSLTRTGNEFDFALTQSNMFFMIMDPANGQITYTRDGDFHAGERNGEFYLTTKNGKLVLDGNRQPIQLGNEEGAQVPGVFTFANPSRLLSVGSNEYTPSDAGVGSVLAEGASMEQGALENSGTDITREMVQMIETQKAFSYAAKMITTSDEVAQTINSLRG